MSDKEQATRLAEAKAVPLHEQLASVPHDARLVIDDADGMGTRYIPIGRMAHEAAFILRRWPDGEPYCYIYEWDTAGGVHQDTTHYRWNGALPNRTIPVYTAPPADRIAALEAALEQARVALRDIDLDARVARPYVGQVSRLGGLARDALRAIEEVRK